MNLLLYGLQRSGTNFLESVLKKNYRVRFLNSNSDRKSPLQKHCRFYKNKKIIGDPQYANDIEIESFEQFEQLFTIKPEHYLVISKDPYSWYLSYVKWATKCDWPAIQHHYIEEYNLFYRTFMDLSQQSNKIHFIRYIDLLTDAEKESSRLQEILQLKKKLTSKTTFKIQSIVPQSPAFSQERKDYYLKQNYLEKFSEEDLKNLNERLDHELVSFLGYQPVAKAK